MGGKGKKKVAQEVANRQTVSLFDQPETQGLHVVASIEYGRRIVTLFQATCDSSLVFVGYDYPKAGQRPFMGWSLGALTPVGPETMVDFVATSFGSLIDGDVGRALAFIEQAKTVFRQA